MGILDDLKDTDIDFPDPHSFVDPYSARSTVAGLTWFVTHSTRSFWQGKRNAKVSISRSTQDGAHYIYQDLEHDDIHNVTLKTDRWGVVGQGKVGVLAPRMRKTPYGIEDEAGEVRADWRATWAVLIVNDAQGAYQGIDLLASTFYNSNGIADAVRKVCVQEHSTTTFQPQDLVEIKSDTSYDYKIKATSDREKQVAEHGPIKTRRSGEKEEESVKDGYIGWEDDTKEEKGGRCRIM